MSDRAAIRLRLTSPYVEGFGAHWEICVRFACECSSRCWRNYCGDRSARCCRRGLVRQSKKKVSVLWRLENAAAVKGDAVPAARVAHPNRCPPILDGRFLSFRRKVSGIGQVKNGSIPVDPCREIGEVLFQ